MSLGLLSSTDATPAPQPPRADPEPDGWMASLLRRLVGRVDGHGSALVAIEERLSRLEQRLDSLVEVVAALARERLKAAPDSTTEGGPDGHAA